MHRSASILLFFSALLCAAFEANAQTAYASTGELKHELGRRQEDLARAEERLASLATELNQRQQNVAAARANLEKVQESAGKRAAVLYRLTRRGVLIRYLLGSSSPVELLRRLGFLRALSITSLEARRQAGLVTAQAEDRLTSATKAHAAAAQLITELKDTIFEIETELDKAGMGKGASPRRFAATAHKPNVEMINWDF
ncbi:MAG: hypothetical protein MUC50_17530 [Myxococcota bacterium]|jgi:chromosome segregation ATPase|nr:hypothetical protein [Myxococcota bacterium]